MNATLCFTPNSTPALDTWTQIYGASVVTNPDLRFFHRTPELMVVRLIPMPHYSLTPVIPESMGRTVLMALGLCFRPLNHDSFICDHRTKAVSRRVAVNLRVDIKIRHRRP
jgi:hypothetical protein